MNLFSGYIEIFAYKMSYLEFTGAISGLIAIWLSAKANIWSWPIGIINVILSFFLYYQSQLYPDMFLQIFFFVTNAIGWWRWANPKKHEEDLKRELKVSFLGWKKFSWLVVVGVVGTIILGALASRLHEWFPVVFALPSAFPYIDSFIMAMSITTTFVMIEKKIESWWIWIFVDVVATVLYFTKGLMVYSALYCIYTGIASVGLWHWYKEYKSYPAPNV